MPITGANPNLTGQRPAGSRAARLLLAGALATVLAGGVPAGAAGEAPAGNGWLHDALSSGAALVNDVRSFLEMVRLREASAASAAQPPAPAGAFKLCSADEDTAPLSVPPSKRKSRS